MKKAWIVTIHCDTIIVKRFLALTVYTKMLRATIERVERGGLYYTELIVKGRCRHFKAFIDKVERVYPSFRIIVQSLDLKDFRLIDLNMTIVLIKSTKKGIASHSQISNVIVFRYPTE